MVVSLWLLSSADGLRLDPVLRHGSGEEAGTNQADLPAGPAAAPEPRLMLMMLVIDDVGDW